MKVGCLRGVFYGMEEDMTKLAGRVLIAALILVFGLGGTAGAHFGMVIPSDNMVMQADDRTIALEMSFSHPMEMVGMPLVIGYTRLPYRPTVRRRISYPSYNRPR